MSADASIADVLEGRASFAVVTGDCLDVLPTLPDRSVAHVIADPPYEAEAHTKGRRIKIPSGNNTCTNKRDLRGVRNAPVSFGAITEAERKAAALQMARLARRWMLVFGQIEAAPRWAASLVAGGAKYRRTCIWVKPNGQPQLSGDRPGMGYETFVVAHAPGRMTWNGGGRCGVFTHNTANNDDGTGEHPTPKPIALMLELMLLFTDPGEVVLDPYGGSGTTGVAALRTGRRVILIEKDPAHADLIRSRLAIEATLNLPSEAKSQRSLFEVAS